MDLTDLEILKELWHDNVYRIDFSGQRLSVIDVGAHRGHFTMFCRYHGARVEAYEPLTTCAYAPADGVRWYRAAVAASSGPRNFYLHPSNPGANSLFQREGMWPADQPIECVNFNQLIEEPIDVLKLDCEGAEYEIIESATPDTLRRIRFLTMEAHHFFGRTRYVAMLAKLSEFFTMEGREGPDGMLDLVYATQRVTP